MGRFFLEHYYATLSTVLIAAELENDASTLFYMHVKHAETVTGENGGVQHVECCGYSNTRQN